MKKYLFALCVLLPVAPPTLAQAQNTIYAPLPGWVVPISEIPRLRLTAITTISSF